MCLAIPACLKSVDANGNALCDIGGIEKEISVALIDDPKPGDWVIVHVGFALNKIDEKEAQATLAALKAVGADKALQTTAEAAQ